jgi:DNA-binding HxlR family transcriptional regulator
MKQNGATRRLCSIGVTLDVIGGRWKGPILVYLALHSVRRFSEIRRFLPDVSPRMLTLQLRELERDQIVARQAYAEVPPRVEYSLTPLGRTLEPALAALRDWGLDNRARIAALRGDEKRLPASCEPADGPRSRPR